MKYFLILLLPFLAGCPEGESSSGASIQGDGNVVCSAHVANVTEDVETINVNCPILLPPPVPAPPPS